MPILDYLVQNGSSTGQFSGMPDLIVFLVALVLAASRLNRKLYSIDGGISPEKPATRQEIKH
jgi:hypothetical protein